MMPYGSKQLLIRALMLCCMSSVTYAQWDSPLMVGTISQHPYLYTEKVDVNGNSSTVYVGFIKDIMDAVAKFSGLSYEFAVRPDSRFGHMDGSTGIWDGLMGDLLKEKVDIVAAPLTETSDRHRVVAFTTWFQTTGPVVVMKRTSPRTKYAVVTLAMRLNRLFDPLSNSVWLLSILAWLITSVTLYFISYVNPYDWRRMCRDREATMREGESFTCLNSFWFTLSAVFWQGYLRCPRSIGARIVVLSWWMYSLIFVSMYIASLTNFLQSGPMTELINETDYFNIDSMADLAYQDKITYGTLEKGATSSFFKHSQGAAYKRMWTRLVETMSFVPSIDAGIEKVRAPGEKPFALIMESAMAKYYVNHQPCDIYMVKDYTTSRSYSFATRIDNTTLGAILDLALLSLRESGDLQHMEDVWFPENKCPEVYRSPHKNSKPKAPHFYKVDLASFSGALILIVIGLVCGSLVTGLEICIYKYAETGNREREPAKKPLNDQSAFIKDTAMHSADPEPMTDV